MSGFAKFSKLKSVVFGKSHLLITRLLIKLNVKRQQVLGQFKLFENLKQAYFLLLFTNLSLSSKCCINCEVGKVVPKLRFQTQVNKQIFFLYIKAIKQEIITKKMFGNIAIYQGKYSKNESLP